MMFNEEVVNKIIFYPRSESLGDLPIGILTTTRCDSDRVCGYLHIYPDSDTLILFFHGNGEIAAEYASLVPLYTGSGASFWVVDYRGYGRSSGSPSFSGMLSDAEILLADVPRIAGEYQLDIKRVIVMGRSLGSASAVHLAANLPDHLAGLILDSPFAYSHRLIQRLGGPLVKRVDIPGFEENLDKMQRCNLPTLIIHGANDQIIPVTESQALYNASQASNKRLLVIENAGHNDLLWVGLEKYSDALKEFLHMKIGN